MPFNEKMEIFAPKSVVAFDLKIGRCRQFTVLIRIDYSRSSFFTLTFFKNLSTIESRASDIRTMRPLLYKYAVILLSN